MLPRTRRCASPNDTSNLRPLPSAPGAAIHPRTNPCADNCCSAGQEDGKTVCRFNNFPMHYGFGEIVPVIVASRSNFPMHYGVGSGVHRQGVHWFRGGRRTASRTLVAPVPAARVWLCPRCPQWLRPAPGHAGESQRIGARWESRAAEVFRLAEQPKLAAPARRRRIRSSSRSGSSKDSPGATPPVPSLSSHLAAAGCRIHHTPGSAWSRRGMRPRAGRGTIRIEQRNRLVFSNGSPPVSRISDDLRASAKRLDPVARFHPSQTSSPSSHVRRTRIDLPAAS